MSMSISASKSSGSAAARSTTFRSSLIAFITQSSQNGWSTKRCGTVESGRGSSVVSDRAELQALHAKSLIGERCYFDSKRALLQADRQRGESLPRFHVANERHQELVEADAILTSRDDERAR